MRLYTGPTTPFGRTVEVLALEAGIALDIEVIAVKDAVFLDAINPLRLIPTLVTDEGASVYDSRVICRFLAGHAPHGGFYPKGQDVPEGQDVAFETRLALIFGVMDAGVARQGERSRPEGSRSDAAIAVYERRILLGIARLEEEAEALARGGRRLDAIAAAVLLDYTDFRFTRDWRATAPRLAAWIVAETERPSMLATRFGG